MKRPSRRISADEIAEKNDRKCADRRPEQGSRAAKDDHQHDFGRNDDAGSLGLTKPL